MAKKRRNAQQLEKPQFDFKVTETIHEETVNSEDIRMNVLISSTRSQEQNKLNIHTPYGFHIHNALKITDDIK